MSTWLVTGGTGFLGRHLLAELTAPGSPARRVVAAGRRRPPSWPDEAFVPIDLDDPEGLARAVERVAPEVVVHAAGQTPPAEPKQFERINTRGTIHLLRALRAAGRPVRVVLVGSAAELGPVDPSRLPVDEDYPCQPEGPYARSKWYATAAGMLARPPLEVVSARVFNPIGPGMPDHLAFGRFARRLAEPGTGPVRLAVGDLDARRDFIDARDVASALVALAASGRAGSVYHVGTGRSHRVGEGLARLIALSGRRVEIEREATARPGPSDSRADIRRIAARTGWLPRIPWEQSLADLWAEASSRARDAAGPSRNVA